MTWQEILMSEEREYKMREEELQNFLGELRKFQEDSRKVRIVVRAKVA